MLLVIAISIGGLFIIMLTVCCIKRNSRHRSTYSYKTYSINSTFENSMKVIERFENGGESNFESLDGSRENSIAYELNGSSGQ